MADQLAVLLVGGPLAGWWITDAEPSFKFDESLTYTFAVEINFEATFPGNVRVPGFDRKPSLSLWAIYKYSGENDRYEANFMSVAWQPPVNCVVVTSVRERPPWE